MYKIVTSRINLRKIMLVHELSDLRCNENDFTRLDHSSAQLREQVQSDG